MGSGHYQVKVTTADEGVVVPYAADFFLDNPYTSSDASCSDGCGGVEAMGEGGGLLVRYTNLTGHILYTAALSYTVERRVDDQ